MHRWPIALLVSISIQPPSIAAEPDLEEVVVTAPYGQALSRDRVPARVQTATASDIDSLQPLDLSDLLNRSFGSVNINQAQNNPLQPDVNFRGQSASPLLGLPQGLSVYANGVRQNETFGDTVNWDLLPVSAVHSVQLLAGTNPVFGLNSLGGALSLRMKDGFSYSGTGADVASGSFGRSLAALQHGGQRGAWGYYGNVDYFEEDGWRDFSASRAIRGYAALGHRIGATQFDFSLAHADSRLRGNGPAPAELLEESRRAVFTHPDITDNRMTQLIAEVGHDLTDELKLSGNVFLRDLRTATFNGDSADDIELGDLVDEQGNPVDTLALFATLNAINNIGLRRQRSVGGSMQMTHERDLGADRKNSFMLGAALLRGKSKFDSVVEVAQLRADRSTTRTGWFADEYRTNVDSNVTTTSLYFADTFDLNPALALTLAGRWDNTRITLADRSEQSPELNGRHRFGRFNPSIGLSWHATQALEWYANLAQASRAPTAVELACADEDAPCSLPNAFLADPPLAEVVARSAELGVRGTTTGAVNWQVSLFTNLNADDILFQTTGGAQGNLGYFANVSDTRRRGLELELSQRVSRFNWQLSYSLIDASYRDAFLVSSPNHPLFEDASEDTPRTLAVRPGNDIPGIARHQANLVLELQPASRWRIAADFNFRSGVFLRGDEINALTRTRSYAVVNLRGEYQASEKLRFYLRTENLLNTKYTNFGLLGEPDEVFPDFEDPRFLGAGAPFGLWVGARARL
jgi:iron complex outermembrane recepter protein